MNLAPAAPSPKQGPTPIEDMQLAPATLLVGATGGPNFGDEAILQGWLGFYATNEPSRRIICDGYNLSNLAKFVGDQAEVQPPDMSLWTISRSLSCASSSKNGFAELLTAAADETHCEIIISLARKFRNAKINHIHFVGGGYFNDVWPAHYQILMIARAIGHLNGIAVTATGQGFLPIDQKQLPSVGRLMDSLDMIDVRDAGSRAKLTPFMSREVTFTGDDALLLLTPGQRSFLAKCDHPSAVVCIQNDLFPGNAEFEALFDAATFQVIADAGIEEIILIAAMPADVMELPPSAAAECERLNIKVKSTSPDALLRDGIPFHPDSVFITSRYHPHFFGVVAGCRGIALTDNAYYETKHKALREIGSNWPILHIESPESLSVDLKKALSSPPPTASNSGLQSYVELKLNLANAILAIGSRQPPPAASYLGNLLENTAAAYEALKATCATQKQAIENATTKSNHLFAMLGAANRRYRDLSTRVAPEIAALKETLASARIKAADLKAQAELSANQTSQINQRLLDKVEALHHYRECLLNAEKRQFETELQLHETRTRLAAAERQIVRFENSRSWKLTHPVRWAAAQARKILKFAGIARH